jgi:hypothetical protein
VRCFEGFERMMEMLAGTISSSLWALEFLVLVWAEFYLL